MGDVLVVGVTMDKAVGKGAGRPVIPEAERLEIVRGLWCVDEAELCEDSIDALERWNPAIFVKGADYLAKGLLKEEIAFCKANGVQIRHTKPNPQTTSGIIERIRQCAFA
jgi:D-beta-D-heptose 7-phosphate kinase/D-beta-D-heptose 1-phosphate adenosyltransferase